MARGFNLTAELNLRGPNNIGPVITSIRRQLSGINVDVGVRVDPRASRDIAAIQQSLTRLNTTLQQTQNVATAASNSLANLGRNINNFAGAVTGLPRNLNNVTAATNNAANAMRQAGRNAQQAGDGFEAFGRQSFLAIRRFAAFATVTGLIYKFTNAVSSATSEFISFNKELVRVAQVTDSSLGQLAPLVKSISQLSTSLGVTSQELITVSSTLAQAGLSARDTEKALKALALSALAPSFDSLNETVEGSIALMRQFSISADGLEGALGSVNAVAAKFAVEASDLITAIQRTGGVFAAASKGVSEGTDALNEFLAIFTSIRQTTRESAETIATGLRTIFTRIQRTETIDALKEYGVVLTDLTGKFVGPYEAVRRLSEGLSRLDPRDLRFSKIVEELGGFRQIGKVIPLIQQFAVAQEALKVAQTGQASLANDAATAQLSLANRFVKVREEFNALIRSLGESSTFQTFVKLSLDLASALIKLADSAKTVLPALTAIAAFRGAAAVTRFGAGFLGGARRQNAGGNVRGFASGGYVPGVGNSDTVPAMLTPGEFVIRKKAVSAIGVNKLHSINRRSGGGRIQKFSAGGIAKAPMIDDILQTTGAILPRPSSIEQLIKAGGGAVDVDRTVKRTTGDKAYGSAPSPGAKQNVINKYFSNDANRLNDIKSAPLTSFGKALQEAVRSGQLNPRKLSIVSKSRRTRGVPEYLSQLFGIPVQNMIFTQGGDKQPAIDAIRSKGPRVDRVKQFSRGGSVQRFANGGLAVLRAKDDLYGGLFARPPVGKDMDPGKILSFSGSKLPRYQGSDILAVTGRPAQYYMSSSTDDDFTNVATQALTKASEQMASIYKIEPNTRADLAEKLTQKIGVNDIAGKMFEGLLAYTSNYFGEGTDSSQGGWDFPKTMLDPQKSGLEKLFGPLDRNKDYDAKLSANPKTLKSLIEKAINSNYVSLDPFKSREEPAGIDDNKLSTAAQKQARINSLKNIVDEANFKLKDSPEDQDKIIKLLKGRINRLGSSMLSKNTKKAASGGSISGEDTVPALLTPGEFVINKKAASSIGLGRLNQLNRADKVQGFNRGGSVGYIQNFANGGSVDSINATAAQFNQELRQLVKILTNGGMSLKDAYSTAKTQLENQARSNSQMSGSQVLRVQNRIASRVTDPNNIPGVGTVPAGPGGASMLTGAGSNTAFNTGSFAAFNANIQAPMGNNTNLSMPAQRASLGNMPRRTMGQSIANAMPTFSGMYGRMMTPAIPGSGPQLSSAGYRVGGLNDRFSNSSIGRGMGRMGGMGAMVATMSGGLAIDSVSKAMGGEKTETGRQVASVGSNALNYGTTGAMLGSMFGPVGTVLGGVAGAAAGVIIGFQEAEKAGQEYAQAQAQAAVDLSSEKSGKTLDKFLSNPTGANRQAFMGDFKDTAAAESVSSGALRRNRASSIGKLFGYQDETSKEFGKRSAKTQQAGADQAEKFLAAEMMRSGKTFQQLSQSMNPTEFKTLVTNIAEADETYATVQAARANEIEKLRASGKDAEANAVQDRANTELAGLATQIAQRKLAEEEAAALAKKEAEAKKQLIVVTMRAVVSLEKTFSAMDQALNKTSFGLDAIGNKREEMLSGRASLTSNNTDKNINILQNPTAYSAKERAAAAAQSTAIMGAKTGGFVNRVAEFSSTARDAALQKANAIQATGAKGGDVISQNAEIGSAVSKTLIDQITSTFGSDSAMAQTLISGVKESVANMVKEAGDSAINPEDLVDAAAGPLIKASEKAGELQVKALQIAQKGLVELGKTAEAVANLQQKQMDRTNNLKEMQNNSRLAFTEALGISVTPQDRINNRMQNVANRVGLASGQDVTASNLAKQRASAIQEQQQLQGKIAAQESAAMTGDPAAIRQLGQFQQRLAEVNNTIANTDRELENLPQTLEANLGDLLNEIQKRVGELEARKEAGANFAERLVTSTPQELAELNATYALLNNTLSGNIVTINRSQVAQKAYYDALTNGKAQQEAFADAQSAFANENKKALSLFNDLTQMSGVKGAEFDNMRADLLVNFAKSQGMGMQNNPIFQKVIAELRKSPEQRAQDDPQIKAMLAQASIIREEQKKAVAEQNKVDRELQHKLLKETGEAIIQKIKETKLEIQVAVQNVANQAGAQAPIQRASGGLIYASEGRLINFQPKGTDTVPAMLTPGEFVVNAKATKDNLPLLKKINSGYYASGGRVVQGVTLPDTPDPRIASILNNTQSIGKDIDKQGNTISTIDKNTKTSSDLFKKITGYSSGGIVYASNGRSINGNGMDTVPAMLTPGEFVVNKESARNNLPLLKQINSGYYAKGGDVTPSSLLKTITQNQLSRLGQDGLTADTWVVVNKKIPFDKSRQFGYIPPTGRGIEPMWNRAAKTMAPNAAQAKENIKSMFNWFNDKEHKIVSGSQIYNSQKLDNKKSSIFDKIFDEILYQTTRFPEITKFNNKDFRLINADSKKILESININKWGPETAQILYSKATERLNYLEDTTKNRGAARSLVEQNPLTRDSKYARMKLSIPIPGQDSSKLVDISTDFVIDWLNDMDGYSNRESLYVKRVWEKVFEAKPDIGALAPSAKKNFAVGDVPNASWYANGGMIYAAKGTLVNYQPRGTDTVPAMLTPGEFVVNRKAAQNNLPLLQSINSGHYSSGGQVAYLSAGTPGTMELTNSLKYFTEILKNGADTLSQTFKQAVEQINRQSESNLTIGRTQTINGVSNTNASNPMATIDSLGAKLDRFIEQLQASIPPVIKVEGEHQVNVVINGATALQNILSGPLGNIVQQAVKSAFDIKSRKNEGN